MVRFNGLENAALRTAFALVEFPLFLWPQESIKTVFGYCTVNVILVEPCSDPLAALTVTVLVPVGVPVFGRVLPPLLLLPPQATHRVERPRTAINASSRRPRQVRLRPAIETMPRKPGSRMA